MNLSGVSNTAARNGTRNLYATWHNDTKKKRYFGSAQRESKWREGALGGYGGAFYLFGGLPRFEEFFGPGRA